MNGQASVLCDGSVIPGDDASLRTTLSQVTADIVGALHFGAGNEQVSLLPAVQFSPEQGLSRDVLYELADLLMTGATTNPGADVAVGGPAGLCELVQSSSSNPRQANALCKTLTNVGKNIATGDAATRDKMLARFRAQLAKGVGHGISSADAMNLSDMSFFLREEEGIFF